MPQMIINKPEIMTKTTILKTGIKNTGDTIAKASNKMEYYIKEDNGFRETSIALEICPRNLHCRRSHYI